MDSLEQEVGSFGYRLGAETFFRRPRVSHQCCSWEDKETASERWGHKRIITSKMLRNHARYRLPGDCPTPDDGSRWLNWQRAPGKHTEIKALTLDPEVLPLTFIIISSALYFLD